MQSEDIHQILHSLSQKALPLLPQFSKKESYAQIDLSVQNEASQAYDLSQQSDLVAFVKLEKQRQQADILWGGYLEQRRLYGASELFRAGKLPRDIHLGIDFWGEVGTAVAAPISGTVHSFQINDGFRDYGPTIILVHTIAGLQFYTLYGHLSTSDLQHLEIGMSIPAGKIVGHFGNNTENGQWPPHVHFQVMGKMYGKTGDFPGVCSPNELEIMKKNCPDPALLFGI